MATVSANREGNVNHGKRVNFTLAALGKLQPDPGRQTTIVWDRDSTGTEFGMRIGAGGKKTFFTQFWAHGKERKETAGTLDEAVRAGGIAGMRKRAAALRAEFKETGLTAKQRREQAAADAEAEATAGMTLSRYFDEEYVPAKEGTKRSLHLDVGIFNNHVRPALGNKLISEITKRDINEFYRQIRFEKNIPVMANRATTLLAVIFNYAVDDDFVDLNPVILKKGTKFKEKPSTANLDPVIERPYFLKALDLMTAEERGARFEVCEVIRLLILTAARSAEVRLLPWGEIDWANRMWRKPSDRTKQKRDHDVPLSDSAVAILRAAQERGQGPGDRVFGGSPKTLSDVFKDVCARAHELSVADGHEPRGFKAFTPHALRRMAGSYLVSERDMSADKVDELLGHEIGRTAVSSVYQQIRGEDLRPLVEALEEMMAERPSTAKM